MSTILVNETITGSQNNNKLSAELLGAINTNTGECSTTIKYDTTNQTKVALTINVKVTFYCPGIVKPQDGAQNISDIIILKTG